MVLELLWWQKEFPSWKKECPGRDLTSWDRWWAWRIRPVWEPERDDCNSLVTRYPSRSEGLLLLRNSRGRWRSVRASSLKPPPPPPPRKWVHSICVDFLLLLRPSLFCGKANTVESLCLCPFWQDPGLQTGCHYWNETLIGILGPSSIWIASKGDWWESDLGGRTEEEVFFLAALSLRSRSLKTREIIFTFSSSVSVFHSWILRAFGPKRSLPPSNITRRRSLSRWRSSTEGDSKTVHLLSICKWV